MRRSPSRLLRVPLVAALGLSAVVVPSLATQSVGATQTAAVLDPALGQYVPIQNTTILDTRIGIGAAAGALPANGSVTVQATGVGQIPSTGVSAIFVNIQVLSSSASGFLTDYAADQPSPIGASVSFDAGFPTSGSDFLTIGGQQDSSQYGMVSFANHSGGTMQLAVQVEGYVTDGTQPSAGDTLFTLPWTDQVDTRSGLGVPNGDGTTGGPVAQLQPGQSVTVSDVGPNGVPYGGASASDIDAMEVTIGALNATNTGYLTVESQNANLTGDGGNQLRTLSYESGLKSRLTEIAQLTSNGTFQITNYGTKAVDVQVVVRGYFLLPTATSVAGSTYQPLSNNTQLCDTRSSCPYGGQQQYTLPAGGSINVQETGTAGIPASGVSGVAAEIDAVSPTATGWLTVNPYGSTPSFTEAFNFAWTHNSNVFDNSTVAQLGANGAITITNVSVGTVDVVVSARGFWLSATVPASPSGVSSTYDGTNATVNWSASKSDGGSPIVDYVVTSSSGSSVSVPANTDSATFATPYASDTISVIAVNGIGSSAATAPVIAQGNGIAQSLSSVESQIQASAAANVTNVTPSNACSSLATDNPPTVAGQLLTPMGTPVAGSEVDLYYFPQSQTAESDTEYLGSTTSGSLGCWSLQLPAISSLDQTVQADISSVGGDFNVQAVAWGEAEGPIGNVPDIAVSNFTASPELTSGGLVIPTPTAATFQVDQLLDASQVNIASKILAATPQVDSNGPDAAVLTGAPLIDNSFNQASSPLVGTSTFADRAAVETTASGLNLTSASIVGTTEYQEESDFSPLTGVQPQGGVACGQHFVPVGKSFLEWLPVGEVHAFDGTTGSLSVNQGSTQTITVGASGSIGPVFDASGSASQTITKSEEYDATLPSTAGSYDSHRILASEKFQPGTMDSCVGSVLYRTTEFQGFVAPSSCKVTPSNPYSCTAVPWVVEKSVDISYPNVGCYLITPLHTADDDMGDGVGWFKVATDLNWARSVQSGASSFGYLQSNSQTYTASVGAIFQFSYTWGGNLDYGQNFTTGSLGASYWFWGNHGDPTIDNQGKNTVYYSGPATESGDPTSAIVLK